MKCLSDPLVTFQSESQNQDLEAIGRLVARAFSMKPPLQHLIILLFSVRTCFEIYIYIYIFHRYVLLAIERSPKFDYILLGIEPMGVNCNVNGRTWISMVLTE